jgi:hypothetical protein
VGRDYVVIQDLAELLIGDGGHRAHVHVGGRITHEYVDFPKGCVSFGHQVGQILF